MIEDEYLQSNVILEFKKKTFYFHFMKGKTFKDAKNYLTNMPEMKVKWAYEVTTFFSLHRYAWKRILPFTFNSETQVRIKLEKVFYLNDFFVCLI